MDTGLRDHHGEHLRCTSLTEIPNPELDNVYCISHTGSKKTEPKVLPSTPFRLYSDITGGMLRHVRVDRARLPCAVAVLTSADLPSLLPNSAQQ